MSKMRFPRGRGVDGLTENFSPADSLVLKFMQEEELKRIWPNAVKE
jgi:hypothetical protein